MAGEVIGGSADEQASAGLDHCGAAELARFQKLNTADKERFGLPFVLAVTGGSRVEILAAFEARLKNDWAAEFETALDQVNEIARLLLGAIALAAQ